MLIITKKIELTQILDFGGAGLMVSALISELSGPDSIALCSWARHFTLTVPLLPSVEMGTGELNAGGKPAMD